MLLLKSRSVYRIVAFITLQHPFITIRFSFGLAGLLFTSLQMFARFAIPLYMTFASLHGWLLDWGVIIGLLLPSIYVAKSLEQKYILEKMIVCIFHISLLLLFFSFLKIVLLEFWVEVFVYVDDVFVAWYIEKLSW